MFVSDPAVSLGIVEQRGVTLLLVCPEPGEKIFLGHPESSGSLYSRLVNGEDVPGWLQQVPIPDSSKSAFKLYEVLPR
jgi:hypothetical protein